jgi:hypothetical protein
MCKDSALSVAHLLPIMLARVYTCEDSPWSGPSAVVMTGSKYDLSNPKYTNHCIRHWWVTFIMGRIQSQPNSSRLKIMLSWQANEFWPKKSKKYDQSKSPVECLVSDINWTQPRVTIHPVEMKTVWCMETVTRSTAVAVRRARCGSVWVK